MQSDVSGTEPGLAGKQARWLEFDIEVAASEIGCGSDGGEHFEECVSDRVVKGGFGA